VARHSWKLTRDPLYRGDSESGISQPAPNASPSIVRHILYLEGFGRPTPYLSATEVRETADSFAGSGGRTYVGRPSDWPKHGVFHRSRKELLLLLRGHGKGDANWPSAFEVMRAHQYVEESQEHLADFRKVGDLSGEELSGIVNATFSAK